MSLNKRPILTLSIFYIIGIWAVHNNYNLILISAMALFCIALLFCFKRLNIIIGLLCFAALILAMWTTNMVITKYDNLNRYNDIGYPSTEKYGIAGMVIDQRESEEYQRLTIKVSEVNEEKADFKMQLYIYDFSMRFNYGDEIFVITKLHEPLRAKFRGDFDTKNYCLSRGIRYIEGVDLNMIMLNGRDEGFRIQKLAFDIRKSFWNSAKKLLPKREAALAQGLMLGDTLQFDAEMMSNFKESGVLHIAALSGFNVSIISLALFYMLSVLSRKRVVLNILVAIGIICFYIIVGYSPSILRAVLMALLAVLGNLFWRRSEIFNALGFSALLILMFNPYALFDVGFQLSFLAVLGIALFIKPFAGHNEILKNSLIMLFIPTLFSLLTTGIVTASAFNRVNFTAIWTNSIIIPLSTVGLIGSYIMCILDVVWHPLAVFASYSIGIVLWLMNKIIDFSSRYAIVNLSVRAPSIYEIALYCGFLYLLYQIEVWVIKKWSEKHY